MGPPPIATVVVPVHNGRRVIASALDALGPQVVAVGAEIVVVDDASTDASPTLVERWARAHPEVDLRLVRQAVHRGVNAARNAGIEAAGTAMLCITDGDDLVAPG